MELLKEKIISAAMEKANPIYVHAMPHNNLVIGNRGLVGNEVKNGIVLSIGDTSASDFSFEENGFAVRLRFAGIWHDVFVPYESICTILDNLIQPNFVFNFIDNEEHIKKKKTTSSTTAKIITPDFKNRKK